MDGAICLSPGERSVPIVDSQSASHLLYEAQHALPNPAIRFFRATVTFRTLHVDVDKQNTQLPQLTIFQQLATDITAGIPEQELHKHSGSDSGTRPMFIAT